MTDEEKAEEIISDYLKQSASFFSDIVDENMARDLIKVGLAEGRKEGYEQGYEDCRHYAHDYYKPKWHDLRKNPNDLPKECKNVLCLCGIGARYYSVGHLIKTDNNLSWWLNIGSKKLYNIIAWCEISKFEEK